MVWTGHGERIEKFLDSYWKKPKEFTFDKTFPEQVEAHFDFLRNKYGDGIMKRHSELCDLFEKDGGKWYRKVDDFSYETGLCEDIDPIKDLGARNTLRIILDHLMDRDQPFAVADLGCGMGKMAIGMASFLDNLEKVYAVDISTPAVKHVKKRLVGVDEKTRAKVVPVHGSYYSKKFGEKIMHDGELPDVVLAAYPSITNKRIVSALSGLLKLDGELVICVSADASCICDPPSMQLARESLAGMYLDEYDRIGKKHGMTFKEINYHHYVPFDMIVAFSGKKK